MAAAKTLTPAQRTERARKAALSTSPQHRTERARKAAAARHSLDTYIKAVVDRAPELTPEQVATLRAILAPKGTMPPVPTGPTVPPTPKPKEIRRFEEDGHQLVTMSTGYAYAWSGDGFLSVGDKVLLPENFVSRIKQGPGSFEATVIEIGSTYDSEHAFIISRAS